MSFEMDHLNVIAEKQKKGEVELQELKAEIVVLGDSRKSLQHQVEQDTMEKDQMHQRIVALETKVKAKDKSHAELKQQTEEKIAKEREKFLDLERKMAEQRWGDWTGVCRL